MTVDVLTKKAGNKSALTKWLRPKTPLTGNRLNNFKTCYKYSRQSKYIEMARGGINKIR